jgi:hypothetical protein
MYMARKPMHRLRPSLRLPEMQKDLKQEGKNKRRNCAENPSKIFQKIS